ncbi:uncharacterized protein NEMAJ01_0619 [Nematocida major]|uniref:uncharacterized protein n=1 Tax=Nematocida major TaxID=1912982 RepID=UPI0020085769|nr:uncharacterized protein NEMAJ01_0619 [Nematocida major]KAH9385723.1 hypothetical protein NEMAJ01_0619 [Nematocida major]
MRRAPFEEKTNEERVEEVGKGKIHSERRVIMEYLTMASEQTGDYNLKYDLALCLEAIQGKENMQVKELKEAVVELSAENEKLVHQCSALQIQLLNRSSQ